MAAQEPMHTSSCTILTALELTHEAEREIGNTEPEPEARVSCLGTALICTLEADTRLLDSRVPL